MQIDRLTVALRPRANWEAIDLGVRMVQAWWRWFALPWVSVYLAITAVLFLTIGYGLDSILWIPTALWWLKPLFDRVLLHIMARAVFGEKTGWRSTWRALPGLMKWNGGLWSTLLLRVLPPWVWWFNTMRSTLLPVQQLEGLRGRAARDRRRLLTRQIGGTAAWLTVAMANFEIIIMLTLVALVILLLPQELIERLDLWASLMQGSEDRSRLFECLFVGIDALIIMFLEPFYVASGFALYLKRRTDLEAWDVELALRRLSVPSTTPTGAQAGKTLGGVASCMVAALVLFVAVPSTVRAEAQSARPDPVTTPPRAKEAIKQVLEQPEFGTLSKVRTLKYVGPEAEEKDHRGLDGLLRAIGKALRMVGKWIATAGRVVIWVGLGLLVCWLAWVLYRQWQFRLGPRVRASAPPAEVAGFDIRPESLPDDVAGAALALARAGQARGCLSLLYRATLSTLAHRDSVEFARGDTEGDCLARVQHGAAARYSFFSDLTLAWEEVAYARHELGIDRLEQLCLQWPRHFAATP